MVADGGDPVGVSFDEADAVQSVVAGNYVVGPDTDLATIPPRRDPPALTPPRNCEPYPPFR